MTKPLKKKDLTWRSMDDIRRVFLGERVTIRGKVLDLRGLVLSGDDLPRSDDAQNEKAIAIRISIPGFSLKNGTCKNIPGGVIGIADNLSFADLEFTEIGEDGLSNVVDRAQNMSVRRCSFHGASDKSGQFNDARGLTLEKCFFIGGITGCRIQESRTKYKDIKTRSVTDNVFNGCQTAWNVSGGVTVRAARTEYNRVGQKVAASHGARLIEL